MILEYMKFPSVCSHLPYFVHPSHVSCQPLVAEEHVLHRGWEGHGVQSIP